MDLNLYTNIMMPINIPQHWLLAWVDVKAKKMHLLDCSREYGKGWRGTIHGLMWIWLLASVRRRNTTTKDTTAEPIWSIDLRTVDVNDLSLLPGFTREARERIRQCRRDKTETLSTVKSILGADNVVKLTNLNIELRWGGARDPRHWQWSSEPYDVPQQKPGRGDCAIFTFLYAAFVTRGWNLSPLKAVDPQAARAWILQVLLQEGKWIRDWACDRCGQGTQCTISRDGDMGHAQSPECMGREKKACRSRQAKLAQVREQGSRMSEDDEVTELLKAACPTTRALEASQGITNPQAGETDPAPGPVSGQQAGSGEAAANDMTLKP